MSTTVEKDPADVRPVLADHSAEMAATGTTIATSTWRIEGAGDGWLQKAPGHAEEHTDTTATVWVRGGVHGETYELVNTLTLTRGDTIERTVAVRVYDQ